MEGVDRVQKKMEEWQLDRDMIMIFNAPKVF